jgi:hypothetical protein
MGSLQMIVIMLHIGDEGFLQDTINEKTVLDTSKIMPELEKNFIVRLEGVQRFI